MPVAPEFTTILLAAGDSTRMGRDKAQLPFGDATVLEVLVSRAARAGSSKILVCTSAAQLSDIDARIGTRADVLEVPERDRSRGPIGSIRHAVRSTTDVEGSTGWLLWPVDHPFVQVTTIVALAQAGGALRRPVHDGRGGHPIFVEHGERDALIAATREPETTLRDYVRMRRDQATQVVVDDAAIHWNCNDRERFDAGYDRFEAPYQD